MIQPRAVTWAALVVAAPAWACMNAIHYGVGGFEGLEHPLGPDLMMWGLTMTFVTRAVVPDVRAPGGPRRWFCAVVLLAVLVGVAGWSVAAPLASDPSCVVDRGWAATLALAAPLVFALHAMVLQRFAGRAQPWKRALLPIALSTIAVVFAAEQVREREVFPRLCRTGWFKPPVPQGY